MDDLAFSRTRLVGQVRYGSTYGGRARLHIKNCLSLSRCGKGRIMVDVSGSVLKQWGSITREDSMKVMRQTIVGTFESSEIKALYSHHLVRAPKSHPIGLYY